MSMEDFATMYSCILVECCKIAKGNGKYIFYFFN